MLDCPPIPLALARLSCSSARAVCKGCRDRDATLVGGALHRGKVLTVELCRDCAARFAGGERLPVVELQPRVWMTGHEAAGLLGISAHGVSRWALRHAIRRRMVYRSPNDGGGCSSYYERASVLAEVERRGSQLPVWRRVTVLRHALGSDWATWISSTDAAAELGVGKRAVRKWARRARVAFRSVHFGSYGRQGFYERAAVLAEAEARRSQSPKRDRMRRAMVTRAAAAGPEWIASWEAQELLGYGPTGLDLWARRTNTPRRRGMIWRPAVLAEAARRRKR